MDTRVTTFKSEVIIGDSHPTVIIGEGINPTGKKALSSSLQRGDLSVVIERAIQQVKAGADILDVNTAGPGIDEIVMLPQAVEAISQAVDVPLCIDSTNVPALEAALSIYNGKALINSVNGEERSLKEILPIAKEFKAAIIALPMTSKGIPNNSEARLRIALSIMEEAELIGILPENVILDCLATSLGADSNACMVSLDTIRLIRERLSANITIGASNVSFGLPDRDRLNASFLAIAISAGVTCPIVDVRGARPIILAADLVTGRDPYAMRYIKGYRDARNKS